VLRFDEFFSEIATHRQKMSVGMGMGVMNHLVPSLGWLGYPFIYELGASLPYSLGWPLYGASLVGVAIAIRRHERADRLVLATIVPYFIIIGSAEVTFPRYLLPLFPGLTILAGRGVWAVGRGFPRTRRVAIALVVAYTLVLTITQLARFSVEQRVALTRFTEDAVRAARPPESRNRPIRVGMPVLLPGLDYFRISGHFAVAGMVPIQKRDGHWFDEQYDAFILPHWEAIYVRRDREVPALARDVALLESGEAGYYRAKRFSSWFLQRDFYTWLDPGFYGDLWQGDIGYDVYLANPRPSPAVPPRG
jgi:hypothetical protein